MVRPRGEPKELLHLSLPADVKAKLDNLLFSPIEGRVPVLGGHEVVDAAPDGSNVMLVLKKRDGQTITRHYEHVIAGTGYRTDIGRLASLLV